jgi:nicotinamide mononucleotide transporter
VSTIEIIAAVFGIISVYLSTRENIWSWPTAIVNVGLYILVFYQARLYADMGLQVFYLGLSFYGWYEWLYGGANRTELHVTRASPRFLIVGGALTVAGSLALGTALSRTTDAAIPYLDSALTVTSLFAQFMMTRKVLENWMLWIALDIVYVPMFISRKLYPTAVLYAVFLVLAIMGLVQWRRSWEASRRSAASAVDPEQPAVTTA